MLQDLVISKVRVKLLETFFSQPTEMFYVRDLVRRTNEEINAVRRELARLEKAGIVKKEPRANRLYYQLNKNYLFYPELLKIVAKTSGLGAQILQKKNKIGRLSFVLFSQNFVNFAERGPDEVDILVVGEVVLPELAALVRAEETRRGKEINYTVMSQEEFSFRRRRRDPFLQSILAGPRVMILGSEADLVKPA